MNASAITLLIVAMLMLWGGLGAAIVNLVRHPDLSAEDD
ncbi:methionine/alanine import family NSS transporter small subunit [Dermabacter sp. p3-SID358]|nr:methionine/alanine import family NSS transporter small subunit [Dermabacter sp. p3-SID358]MCT1867137.1 methionine/alanine import family NSS transporter small subunit [Dermabacter sp. p3-SID358]